MKNISISETKNSNSSLTGQQSLALAVLTLQANKKTMTNFTFNN